MGLQSRVAVRAETAQQPLLAWGLMLGEAGAVVKHLVQGRPGHQGKLGTKPSHASAEGALRPPGSEPALGGMQEAIFLAPQS